MFRRLMCAVFREPKVILPKLCVCYVIGRICEGYRLVLDGIHSLPTDSTRRYPLPSFTYSAYDVAYTQFRQNHFGLPEDGAPEAPKHIGAS
jgi:hypothetical protein